MAKELWDFVLGVMKPLWIPLIISLIIHLIFLSRIKVPF
jgi:hypothetical protein